MSDTKKEVLTEETAHYTDEFIKWCELDFGAGFLSPGGRQEVAKIVEGLDLQGKAVLDIGVGLAGPACALVEDLGTAMVTGIDVETLVLKRAAETVQSHGPKPILIIMEMYISVPIITNIRLEISRTNP